MYCFKFQKFKKLFIVFITVLTISLTIGIYTITSSASVNFDQVQFGGVSVYFNGGNGRGTGSVPIGTIDSFYFSKGSSSTLTMNLIYSDSSESKVTLVASNTTYFTRDFVAFDISYGKYHDKLYQSSVMPLIIGEIYDMPSYDGSVGDININLISPSFQLFTTRIVKNGSVIESGTAQLNKAIYNPDSFTFSFYDNGLVGLSFRVSAVQTTPSSFNGSAFPPLNINLGEVAKVVIYDKDGNELGFVNGPFQENREYNIKEYFPDVDTFEIVISTPILVEETANGLTASLGWVGSVISSLVSPNGDLFPLLSLFAISICVSLLLLAFYYIRKAIWGS